MNKVIPSDGTTKQTANLFGSLWRPFDDEEFEFSVNLFRKRFTANGFDMSWFKEKRCLDVGCGGGRYSIAMAREGASEVVGVDIASEGLEDAKRRAKHYPQVKFEEGSVLAIPFADETFDFVFCSGVLMITEHPENGFAELCRVLKPEGKIYLLLYATGGVRWPAVMDFRDCLKKVPVGELKRVMQRAGFHPGKIRTLIDDLKVPIIDVYTWEYVLRQLHRNSITNVERWKYGRYDHEESLDEMVADMEYFDRCFAVGAETSCHPEDFQRAHRVSQDYLSGMRYVRDSVVGERIAETAGKYLVIGQGHHRLIGEKV